MNEQIDLSDRVQTLTETLVSRRSVTPDDAECQNVIIDRLKPLGFEFERLDTHGVQNLWATLDRGHGPHLILAGHTDVVPTGPVEDWHSDPFEPSIRDGYLYGRGTADMKASLAAMIVATEQLLETKDIGGKLSFLITSDEEGVATHGTRHVVAELVQRGLEPDYCIVGEPSSSQQLGDVVRCGRRGSLNATIIIRGIQGHVAYPTEAKNPIHAALPAFTELCQRTWDQGNDYYPPTSFQISNLQSGTGATNVIPGTMEVKCNFRFNTEQTAEMLENEVESVLTKHGVQFDADWQLSGQPFLTTNGNLTSAVSNAIRTVANIETELSTSGGTSDGRFIAPWGNEHKVEVVELGPVNSTIHKIDECVRIADLGPLAQIYQLAIEHLLVAS